MQVPGFTICYTAANVSNPAGRDATGFPLPSTGRGIEGEGWSYPEPPPVRFFLYQPHPGSRLNTSPENPRINTFITMNERLQTRVARATGPYRPATRRTERVRRSFSQRTPFVIPKLKPIKNPRNITFYALKPHPAITQRIVANPWVVGRVTPCAPLLTSKSASHRNRQLPAAFLNT